MEEAAKLYKTAKAPQLSKAEFSAKLTEAPLKGKRPDFPIFAEYLYEDGYDALKKAKKVRKKDAKDLMAYYDEMKQKTY